MKLFQKGNELLDKETKTYNYLKKAERIVDLLLEICGKEKKVYGELRLVNNKVREQFMQGFFKRMFVKKESERVKKDIMPLLKKLEAYTNQEKKLLVSDLEIMEAEKGWIIKELEKLPLLSKMTENERGLMQQLVIREGDEIKCVFYSLTELNKALANQKSKLGLQINDVNANDYKSYVNSIPSSWEVDYKEKHLLEIKEKLNYLENASKKILEQNKKLANKFINPGDFKLFSDDIKKILKESRCEEELITDFLKKQRVLRNPLEANSLIVVHKTDYFPKNGIIKPRGNFKVLYGGKRFPVSRQTIHFALNGPVKSHMYGNWDGKKIAILIPFNLVAKRIITLRAEDSFVFGELKLPVGSEIIISEGDIAAHQKIAGDAKVIPRELAESLDDTIIRRIKERGYTPMRVGMWGWERPYDKFLFDTIGNLGAFPCAFEPVARELGMIVDEKIHYDSVWEKTDMLVAEIEGNLLKGNITEKEKQGYRRRLAELMLGLYKASCRFHLKDEKETRESYLRVQRLLKQFYAVLGSDDKIKTFMNSL